MILEQLRDFYRRPREIKAIEQLQHPETYPGLAPWREHDTRVRFICLPSFEPYSVWALQRRDKVSQVRRIEWDHVADVQLADALPDSAPTIYGADAPLPPAAVDGLLDELAAISLPPFLPVNTLGLDGVTFGDSWRSACLSWWAIAPEPWQPLVRCYERAISLFEAHLPASTARGFAKDQARSQGPPR